MITLGCLKNPTQTLLGALEPIFHYHLTKKMKGIKKSWELVGLTKDEIEMITQDLVVTKALLSQLTPESFDICGVFLGPLKTSLKSCCLGAATLHPSRRKTLT